MALLQPMLAFPSVFGCYLHMLESSDHPAVDRLGRWLRSWVHSSGAIHGFHNHSVWGNNPYRVDDMWCGHSTFASPLLPALAIALRQNPDQRGQALLERLIDFQCRAKQPNGQFRHIGFEMGELITSGLIHNMVPCVALCLSAIELGDALPAPARVQIEQSVRDTIEACNTRLGLKLTEHSTSNQSYCHLWAMLLHMEAFGHSEWDAPVREMLDELSARFHVAGLPDPDCIASLRSTDAPGIVEPTEYYGLMIHPLMCAAQRYGQPAYLDSAKGFALHVVRSAWRDGAGLLRFHRLWRKTDNAFIKIREPMLIGGMGITLSALQKLNTVSPDPEFDTFLTEMDRTYHHYQNPAGFFLSASGWYGEQDVIPSSAWQSHDLFHLVQRHPIDSGFWDHLFSAHSKVAVVLGTNLFWAETDTHWTVRGYESAHGLELVGRKDNDRFNVDIPRWVQLAQHAAPNMLMPDQPKFLRTDDALVLLSGRSDIDMLNATQKIVV